MDPRGCYNILWIILIAAVGGCVAQPMLQGPAHAAGMSGGMSYLQTMGVCLVGAVILGFVFAFLSLMIRR